MTATTLTPNGKTGGNGAATAAKPANTTPVFDYSRLRDLFGVEYVRGWECSHLLNILETAFSQAETCARKAGCATSEAQCRDLVVEALKCVSTAEHYARMLLDQIDVNDPRIDGEF